MKLLARLRRGDWITPRWHQRLIVLTLLLLGFGLRLSGIGRIPPGLYRDEAQHGLDALDVLNGGGVKLYFEANNGREPLYIYLVTASIALLGRSPLAVRLPAVYVGFLTLAASYALAHALWNRRLGRWTLATLTVTFWHIHLSHVGFRAILLPLCTALSMTQIAYGIRSRKRRHWLAAGLWYGLGWYTYTAARFTPVAIAAVSLYGLCCHRHETIRLWRGALQTALVAMLILLPLGIFAALHPDVVLTRVGQVSVFDPAISGGHPWRTLLRQGVATAMMFTIRGDRIWRHNLAWRPVWGPAIALTFTLGLGVALARIRRDAGLAVALIWTVVMALPTALAEDAPHFLRAVGVLPTAALLPAQGLDWLYEKLSSWNKRAIRHNRPADGRYLLVPLIAPLLIVFELATTTTDYFVRYAQAGPVYYWFEGGPTELAGTMNAFLGVGWAGRRMQHGPSIPATIFIDQPLWETWASLPFLTDSRSIHFLPVDQPTETHGRLMFVTWPYRDWHQDVLAYLPHPAYLTVREGPTAQGDLDPEPFTFAMITSAEPRPPVPPPLAVFDDGIILRAALFRRPLYRNTQPTIWLWWDVSQTLDTDYTVFVHYLRNEERIAQHDGSPGYGHLPTSSWEPGDLILDIHPMPNIRPQAGQDNLRIGLYDAQSGKGLAVVDSAGNPLDDAAHIPVILAEP